MDDKIDHTKLIISAPKYKKGGKSKHKMTAYLVVKKWRQLVAR